MTYLEQASKPTLEAPMITIVGFPGSGKSSLGGLFPNPIFIQAEASGAVFDKWDDEVKPMLMPELPQPNSKRNISTKQVLKDQLIELGTADHPYKTIVFDTITSLNTLFEEEVVDLDEKDNIAEACGGFHKGYLVSASYHAEIMKLCVRLQKKGIAIVFLAHASTEKVKNRPDGLDYCVYTMEMHQHARKYYTNHSDAVLYLKSEEKVTGSETDKKGRTTKYGKIIDTGNRILITNSDGVFGYINAKNRFGLESKIAVPEGENPLIDLIPFLAKQKEQSK